MAAPWLVPLLILFKVLLKLFKLILSFLRRHAQACLYIFDPVYVAPPEISLKKLRTLEVYRKVRAQSAELKYHKYFILPILVWIILAGDTLWILFKNKFQYETNPIPEMFTHRMYPQKFYQQGDMLVLTVSTGIVLMGLVLWRFKWLDDRYAMYFVYGSNSKQPPSLIVNGRVWNEANAKQIYKFRKFHKQFVKLLASSSQIIGYGYFLFNFINAPFNDIKYYVEMILYLPILTWYCVFTVAFMFFHFFVATQYVLIKQSYQLKLMHQLIATLENARERHRHQFTPLWFKFLAINRLQAYQCTEIAGYNKFWSRILTILFSVEMITFCYLLFCVLYYEQTIDQFIYFVFFLVELGVFIFAIIYRCSLVDNNNGKAYAANVKVCMLFQFYLKSMTPRQMVNIEKIATNRNFSRCCFRLSNNYRLDATAFQMAIYMCSTFFLMICRRNKRIMVYG